MNISIEYLTRTRLIEDLTTFPCSFFLNGKINFSKVAICINQSTTGYSVKRWNISECSATEALPPMEEYNVEDIFHDPHIIMPDMEILRCRYSPIPSRENTSRKPMENYIRYFNDYLTKFDEHQVFKERWLWNSFLNIYYPELIVLGMSIKRSLNMYGDYAALEIMENQKQIIEHQYPKLWKFWNMWHRHMLDFTGIPGEFVFNSCFNTDAPY